MEYKKVIETKEVPVTNAVQCGNYRDHSLFGAIKYVKHILDKGISDNIKA